MSQRTLIRLCIAAILCCTHPYAAAVPQFQTAEAPAAGLADSNARIQASPPALDSSGRVVLTDEERTWLREHPVIRVTQDPDWAPVEFADAQGRPTGMSEDYLRLVEQRLGIAFERVLHLTWPESMERLKKRDIDMTTSVTSTPDRLTYWAFTRPYMQTPIVILTHKDVTYIFSMRDLAGKTVAIVDGYALIEWLGRDYPDIRIQKVQRVEEGLALLQRGKVFAYIDNMLITGFYTAKLTLADIKVAGTTPYVNAMSMAVRKDWAPLAGILQKALDSITERERAEIYARWVPIRYEHGFDYTLLWQALAVFAVILAGMLVWNRKLSREIRQRKQAEEALRKSNAAHAAMIENIGDVIAIVDAAGTYTYVSPNIERFFGWRPAELLGTNGKDTVHPEDAEHMQRRFTVLAGRDGAFETVAYRNKCRDGTYVWIELTAVNRTNDPDINGILLNYRDITERRRTEAERQLLEQQLQQIQRIEGIGTLASGIAHDFNNILNAIMGNASLIDGAPYDAAKVRHRTGAILKAAERGAHLVKQLLTFARKAEIQRRTVHVNDLILEIAKLLEETFPKTIDIGFNLDPALPPIHADPNQLHQVLLNISVNARDAMPAGGTFTIATRSVSGNALLPRYPGAKSGQYVEIRLRDSGTGMDEQTLKKIFDPFFTTKEIGKGTGLGLPVVFGIIERHGGLLDVASAPGRGTEFILYLPLAASAVIADETPSPSFESIPGGRETILVVEDEDQIRQTAIEVLEKKGYSVVAAGDGAAGVEAFQHHAGAIALVVTDLGLPKFGGDEVFRRITELQPDIPVMIVSGFIEPERKAALLKAGIRAVVQKPYTPAELAKAVRDLLDQKRQ